MKVKELIEKLQKMPQDRVVIVEPPGDPLGYFSISEVINAPNYGWQVDGPDAPDFDAVILE